jgi:hypothetical protein
VSALKMNIGAVAPGACPGVALEIVNLLQHRACIFDRDTGERREITFGAPGDLGLQFLQ